MNRNDEIKKFMSLDIQLFAEDDKQPADNNEDKNDNEGTEGKDNSEPEKKYTDDDVNSISKKNADKATKKLMKDLGIEDVEEAKNILANARAEKDKNKTAEDITNDLAKTVTDKDTVIAKKNEQLVVALLENQLIHSGVESSKIARAKKMINAKDVLNEDGDIDNELMKTEIDKLLNEFPEFKKKSDDNDQKKEFKFGSDGKQDNKKQNNMPNSNVKRWNRFN